MAGSDLWMRRTTYCNTDVFLSNAFAPLASIVIPFGSYRVFLTFGLIELIPYPQDSFLNLLQLQRHFHIVASAFQTGGSGSPLTYAAMKMFLKKHAIKLGPGLFAMRHGEHECLRRPETVYLVRVLLLKSQELSFLLCGRQELLE